MTRAYYKIEPGSTSAQAVSDFTSEYNAVRSEWEDFAKSYKVTRLFANSSLLGLMFEEEDVKPPEGWLSTKGMPASAFKPARKKVCMEAYKVFSKLKSEPSGHRLANLLSVKVVFAENAMHYPTFEYVGEDLILSLHEDCEAPEGVVALKASEYYQLKENL